jgi:hypothetical protein
MHKRGFTNGCKSVFKGGGVYLGLTGYFYASMLMKEEVEKAGLLQTVSENTKWWTRDELINLSAQPWNKEQRAAIKQADQVRTFYNNRLLALITAPDSDLKTAEEMLLLTDVYNEACNISHGWGGFIKPDFTGYHHHGIWGGHYNTGAALVSAMMSMHTRQTAYSFSSDAINNLSQVMLANRFYCNKYDYALGLSGRFPTSRDNLVRNMPAFAYLIESDKSDFQPELKAAFKRLLDSPITFLEDELASNFASHIIFYGGLGGLQQLLTTQASISTPAEIVEGNRVFPYGNLQIHRRANWMASVKGYSKYVWDYENNGQENWFGRNQSAGSLEIFASANDQMPTSSTSGWQEEGYDWDHIPGTTTFDLPNWTDHDKSFNWAKFSPEYFVGGVALENQNGVYAIKYVDVRETGWLKRDYKLHANKSYFFFDDQIVCLGSNINSVHPSYKVHTTLFQNVITEQDQVSNINGLLSTGTSLHYTHKDNTSVYLTDLAGNSYFLRNGVNLNMTRETQTSRDNKDTKDTQGDFAKAWINHDEASNADYEYLVWIQAPAEKIAQLAQNPDDWYKVKQKNEAAHIVTHLKKKMTGYAIFEPNSVFNTGIVYTTNNDCLLMFKETDKGILLSAAHPDLGWLDKNESLYQVWHVNDDNRWLESTVQPVDVTLRGKWQITKQHPSVTFVDYDATNDRTTLNFQCLNGKSLEVGLSKTVSTDITNQEETTSIQIYPNPASQIINIKSRSKIDKLELINLKGSVVQQFHNLATGTHTLPLNLASGIYTLRLTSNNQTEVTKLKVL